MRQKLFGEQLLTLKQQRERTRLWSAFRTRS
jgi:putrescine transport system substrate-binding protein